MKSDEALGVILTIGPAEFLAGLKMPDAEHWVEVDVSPQEASLPEQPRHLLICDTALPGRPATVAGCRIWAGRQLGEGRVPAPPGAGGLLLNMMDIDAAHEEEFNDWYDTEHLPRIAAVEGVILARRFHSGGDAPRYLATYHLRSLDVVRGDAWRTAAATPWTARMRRHRTGLVRIGFAPLR